MEKIKPIYKMRDVWVMRVKSSNIRVTAYDVKNKILYIQFKTQNPDYVYRYFDVPVNWWIQFTMAESKGKYFQKAKYDLENFDRLKIEVKKKKKSSTKKYDDPFPV